MEQEEEAEEEIQTQSAQSCDDDGEEENETKSNKKKIYVPINDLGPALKLITPPCRVNLVGRSTMGKTTLAVDIIMTRLIMHVHRVFAVCPTFWNQPALEPLRKIEGCFTDKNVYTQVDDEVFDTIYDIIDPTRYIPTLLFVDDSAAEAATNMGNKGAFSRLCLASPHLNLTIVGVFQRGSSCTVSLRDNTEFVVVFKPTKTQDIDMIVDENNPFPALKESAQVIRQALHKCWQHGRYVFIYREPFTGAVKYYCDMDKQVQWPAELTV